MIHRNLNLLTSCCIRKDETAWNLHWNLRNHNAMLCENYNLNNNYWILNRVKSVWNVLIIFSVGIFPANGGIKEQGAVYTGRGIHGQIRYIRKSSDHFELWITMKSTPWILVDDFAQQFYEQNILTNSDHKQRGWDYTAKSR